MPGLEFTITLDLDGADRLGRYTLADIRRRFAELMGAAMQEVALPAMRDASPERTGRLKRALFTGHGRAVVSIGVAPVAWYWRFQEGLGDEYERILLSTLEQVIPPIQAAIVAEAMDGYQPEIPPEIAEQMQRRVAADRRALMPRPSGQRRTLRY